MTRGCNVSAIMASDSPGRFSDYLNSDSVRVSSQVLIMCHDNTIIPNVCKNAHNIKFHVSRNKTQNMHTKTQTWEISQSNQSRTTSTFLHDVSLRSVSNSKFWMPSRTLLSPSSLRDIWQQNEPQTTKKQYADKIVSTASISVSRPLLNSSLVPVLSHIVLSENNKWTSSWQDQLFSCRYTRRIPVPLALCSGIDIRGIPCGIPASPVSAYTLEGRTLPSPSKDRDVVKQIWYAPWPPRSPEKVVI